MALDKESLEKVIGELKLPPMKKWRCSRGHKWESPFSIVGMAFHQLDELGIPVEDFCMLCLFERCRDGLGRVREDT